ncbi:HIT-like protein [Lentithecium fluviatile CBS 122367]|uniref:HIT-like protein n=1 Tax=Lentithecium fluviatile CBS 122367 TaxID=1168545 RepID=A0A6G1IUH2_9PLEO|nr:HIT-like protein [Lentithecium fluviatile CBS 122367]
MSTSTAASIKKANDAITAAEFAGEGAGNHPQPSEDALSHKRPNAFTKLMANAKKPKAVAEDMENKKSTPKTAKTSHDRFRDALGIYIDHPEQNPEGRVVDFDDEFVLINDGYPKSSVHLLLLPRDPAIYFQHPLDALSTNPTFLAKVCARVEKYKHLAARELRRQYGAHSTSDSPYQTALETLMSSDNPPSPDERDALLPPGRDWLKEIIAGVHTHPSMNHMHVHILSREHNSPYMKHKKHYLSFNTSFLVQMEELPLEEGSPRFHPGDWPSWDMKCWRCGKNFKNKMAALLRHMEEEIEEWKRE